MSDVDDDVSLDVDEFGSEWRQCLYVILMVSGYEGRCKKEGGRRLKRFCTKVEAHDIAIALTESVKIEVARIF